MSLDRCKYTAVEYNVVDSDRNSNIYRRAIDTDILRAFPIFRASLEMPLVYSASRRRWLKERGLVPYCRCRRLGRGWRCFWYWRQREGPRFTDCSLTRPSYPSSTNDPSDNLYSPYNDNKGTRKTNKQMKEK